MTDNNAALRQLIAEGFSDDEIMKVLEKRKGARPPAALESSPPDTGEPEGGGSMIGPRRAQSSLGRSGSDAGVFDLAKRRPDQEEAPDPRQVAHDRYVEDLRSGKTEPNFLQRAFPPRKTSEDPIQADPLASMILSGVVGAGAGSLPAAGGRLLGAAGRAVGGTGGRVLAGAGRVASSPIMAGGAEGATASVTAGGDPVSGGLIGSAARVPGAVGRAARAVERNLLESPQSRGRDLRVMQEFHVEPRTLGTKGYSDPFGAMPDPRRFAPTDSGRGQLGEEAGREALRRTSKARQNVKADLDAETRRALMFEGDIPVSTAGQVDLAEGLQKQKNLFTGTGEKLGEIRRKLVSTSGSPDDASEMLRRANTRRAQSRDRDLPDNVREAMDEEARRFRQRGTEAVENPLVEHHELPVRELHQVRDLADEFRNFAKKNASVQEKPFADMSQSINQSLDLPAPMLRAADRHYHERMGGVKTGPHGESQYSGIEGAEALMGAKKPATLGQRLASVGQDTISGGVRDADHRMLKSLMEDQVDEMAGVQPGEMGSRLLLSQPELLLARQRQKWFGSRPAKLPGSEQAPNLMRQITGTLSGFGEPVTNRLIYPNAKRIANALEPTGPRSAAKGAGDVLTATMLGKDSADRKRKKDKARKGGP